MDSAALRSLPRRMPFMGPALTSSGSPIVSNSSPLHNVYHYHHLLSLLLLLMLPWNFHSGSSLGVGENHSSHRVNSCAHSSFSPPPTPFPPSSLLAPCLNLCHPPFPPPPSPPGPQDRAQAGRLPEAVVGRLGGGEHRPLLPRQPRAASWRMPDPE